MYDVIVVGAGPAGSTAATVLAKAGMRTLLVDRENFPREKACGDAVPASAFALMQELGLHGPFDSTHFYKVEQALIKGPRGVTMQLPLTQEHGAGSCIVTRYIFDQILLQNAMNRGTEFCSLNVTGVIFKNQQVIGIKAKSGKQELEFLGKVVIAADGASSIIARALKTPQPEDKYKAVALRGYVETERDLDTTARFSFLAPIQLGYGWFFPLGKRQANIGVGMRIDSYKQRGISLPKALELYLETPEIRELVGENKIQSIKTWQIPLCVTEQRRTFDGAILVGDAGGFVNPLTGGGIYQAMATGKYAAQASIRALQLGDSSSKGLSNFEMLWRKDLEGEMKRAAFVQNSIATVPSFMDAILFAGQHFPRVARYLIGKL